MTQNALLAILHRLSELREPASLDSFVRTVALHQCVDFRRRRATRRARGPGWGAFDVAAEEAEVEERIAIREALEALPAKEREVLLLAYATGLKQEEIAISIKQSEPTVRRRLLSAKRRLRSDLGSLQTTPMKLEGPIQQLVDQAFPNALVASIQPDPETWLPYNHRIVLSAAAREETVDVRTDVDDRTAKLLPELSAAGIPTPRILAGPVQAMGVWSSLWRPPHGPNLTTWTMDGTYHRFRTATDLVLKMLDRLQAFSPQAKKLGVSEVSLQDRLEELKAYTGAWASQEVFVESMSLLDKVVPEAERPLVFGHYLQFFPNYYRVTSEPGPGYPSDESELLPPFPTRSSFRISEVVYPFGQLTDPLLGLAMVWIYDCYPFVHTGFVEQYLTRHDVPRRAFAIRLALQALTVMARELPVEKVGTDDGYARSLLGLLKLAREWMR